MYYKRIISAILLLGAVFVSACDKEEILQGTREPVRAARDLGDQVVNKARRITLPRPKNSAQWTNRSANVAHNPPNSVLAQNPSLVWSASIGQGNRRNARITAAPIIAQNTVFTVDSAASLTATNLNGTRLWSTSLIPAFERGAAISGGGLTFAKGRLFATTGYGELIALNPVNGTILWRQKLLSPISGPPTAYQNSVYVTTRDGAGHAIDARNGRLTWSVNGVGATATVVGEAAPTISGRNVIFPSNGGELRAVLRLNGEPVWNNVLSGRRLGRAYAGVNAITADPVVNGALFLGTSAGRSGAFNLTDGTLIWSLAQGALHAPVVVGDSVFIISDENRLLRVSRANGDIIWQVELPYFKSKKRNSIYTHYGPVLASSRLAIASSDGVLRFYAPQSGELLSSVNIPGGAATAPALVNGTLFIVSGDGDLHAFR